jgi:hypothetical protein
MCAAANERERKNNPHAATDKPTKARPHIYTTMVEGVENKIRNIRKKHQQNNSRKYEKTQPQLDSKTAILDSEKRK